MELKSLLVYSSRTGNTKKVGEAIAEVFQNIDIFPVAQAPSPEDYDFILVGFWVNRGTADDEAKAYMARLKNKKVALFATLGAYPDSQHAVDSMERAGALLDASNQLKGTFICQGKVDGRLLEKFRELPTGHPHAVTPEREARHREAAKHPDSIDLERAQKTFAAIRDQLN